MEEPGVVGLVALRGRCAGGGRKPPRAAAVKSRGGERRGKVAPLSAAGMSQEGERKRTTDDVSKDKGDVETGDALEPRDESGGSLLTAQVASGVEVARAWFGLLHGTWEPVAPTGRPASGAVVGLRSVAHGRSPSSGNCKGLSTGAGHRGGPSRSSAEGPVMGPERRGRIVRACLAVNRLRVGGAG
jgi:hypothetical protein